MATSRAIFEEVSEKADLPQAKPHHEPNDKAARIWLWLLFVLVVIMMLVGALTRLTDSGLSITDWDLIVGTLPPLNSVAWEAAFTKYQTTQEFQLVNAEMTLAEFKPIFWWEWSHRFLGRVIGLVWALGFVFLSLRGDLRRDCRSALFGLGILIGLQGVLGILMVKSGYVGQRVDVASYALASHLSVAFIILGVIYWNLKWLRYKPSELVEMRRRGDRSKTRAVNVLMAVTFLQIILGALVAGIDGGRSYTDWPMMGGEFFSSDAFVLSPWWKNLFENPALVQWLHRMNAYLLAGLSIWFWLRGRRAAYKQWRFAGFHFMTAIFIQIFWGIFTLTRGAPVFESLIHQFLAIGIWVLLIVMRFGFAYPKPQHIHS